MTMDYPFYGRMFDILSFLKVKPWFEGQERAASWGAANYLIALHQVLLANFVIEIFKKHAANGFYISQATYIACAIPIFSFNLLAFSRWHKITKRNKLLDVSYTTLFLLSFIYFIFVFFNPSILMF